jgi:hypothetical protein
VAIQPPNSYGFNTYPIDTDGTDPTLVTVFSPSSDARFAVYHLHLINIAAAALYIVCRSGATDISGDMFIPLTGTTTLANRINWCSDRVPILVGRLPGEPFKINKTGTGWLSGFATVGEFIDS